MMKDDLSRISVYSKVVEYLMNDKEVLFIGLGCDIGTLRLLCNKKNIDCSKLYCLELICHGATFNEVHSNYVKDLENKYKSKIIDFTVRYKNNRWTPPYICARFKNGHEFLRPFYCTDYGIAFSRYATPQCYSCKYKGENHKGDLVIGDYWGINEKDEGWNEKGVSAILVLSDKGKQLLSFLKMNKQFHIFRGDTKLIIDNNSPYYKCRDKTGDYNTFRENLANNTLRYAINNIKLNLMDRIKMILKRNIPSFFLSFFMK